MWKHVRDSCGFCREAFHSRATLPRLALSMLMNDELLIPLDAKWASAASASGTSNHIESYLTIHFSSAVSLCHLILLYDSTSLKHTALACFRFPNDHLAATDGPSLYSYAKRALVCFMIEFSFNVREKPKHFAMKTRARALREKLRENFVSWN